MQLLITQQSVNQQQQLGAVQVTVGGEVGLVMGNITFAGDVNVREN